MQIKSTEKKSLPKLCVHVGAVLARLLLQVHIGAVYKIEVKVIFAVVKYMVQYIL